MIRAMKWIGGLVLLLLVLFAGLIILLPKLIDPNVYKDKISDLVYDKSGYRIEIPGDIRLHVSPRLDVLFSLGQVRVLSAPGFSEDTLVSSEEARIELSLLPLLREKRLAIQGIQLHGGYCYLVRNKAGKGNWELPASKSVSPSSSSKKTVASGTPSPSEAPNSVPAQKKRLPTLDLGGLEFSRINIRYEDQQTGKRFELKDFNMHSGRVQDNQPFHLQSGFTLTSSGNSNSVLSVKNTFEADVTLGLAAKTKSIQLDNLSLVSLIKAFGLQETEVKLATNAFVDLVGKKAKLEKMKLSSGELVIQLNAEVVDFAKPSFSGNVQVPDFSLRKFLQQNKLPQPEWKEDSALNQVGFSCDLKGNTEKITVSDIKILLDQTHGEGRFVLTNLKKPAYDLQMHFDRFDLDRYATVQQHPVAVAAQDKNDTEGAARNTGQKNTGVAAGSGKGSGGARTASQPLDSIFPVELLRKLQFVLDLGVDSMKIRGADLSKVELKASGKNGLLNLKPFSAKLYDGAISAESTLDVRGKLPKLSIKQNFDRVQVGPLIHDMTGKEEVTGAMVMSLQVTSSGNSRKRLINHAKGKMNLALEDGIIKKLHILQVIRQAKALYDGEALVTNAVDEPTGFARLSASGVIKQGVFHNNDLKAASDLMKVTGSGNVDFNAEYVDYLLKISLTRAMDRDDKSGRAEFSKFVVPYRIHGNFSNIKEEADVVGILKSQAKSLLMKELQKQLKKGKGDKKQDDIKDLGTQLLEQGLKGLFGD